MIGLPYQCVMWWMKNHRQSLSPVKFRLIRGYYYGGKKEITVSDLCLDPLLRHLQFASN